MTKTRIPLSPCFRCNEPFDAAALALPGEPPVPRAGDFFVCPKCGDVTRFRKDLTRRALTQADADEVQASNRLSKRLSLAVAWAIQRKLEMLHRVN